MKNFIYKQESKQQAFVYVIHDPNGYMKIGISKNVNRRVKQLQTGHPTKLEILFAEEFYCTRNHLLKIESLIHGKIKEIANRMNGEWFEIPLEKLEEIKKIIIWYRIHYEENEVALKHGLRLPQF